MIRKKSFDRYKVFREQYGYRRTASTREAPLVFRFLARFARTRIDKVSSLLPDGKFRVLDIGCGDGNFLYTNKRRWRSLVGVDVLQNLIQIAKKKAYPAPSEFSTYDFGLKKMPYRTSSFDLVVSIATLQYVYDLELIFSEIYRVLKPKGYFIFEVPNSVAFWKRFKFLFGNFPNSTEFTNQWDGGVIHYFTKKNIFPFVKQKGFNIKKISCSGIWDRIRDVAPEILGGDLIIVCSKDPR